jgi:hypothetical protein
MLSRAVEGAKLFEKEFVRPTVKEVLDPRGIKETLVKPIKEGRIDKTIWETAKGLVLGMGGFADATVGQVKDAAAQLILRGDIDWRQVKAVGDEIAKHYEYEPKDPGAKLALGTLGAIPQGLKVGAETIAEYATGTPSGKAAAQTTGDLAELFAWGKVFGAVKGTKLKAKAPKAEFKPTKAAELDTTFARAPIIGKEPALLSQKPPKILPDAVIKTKPEAVIRGGYTPRAGLLEARKPEVRLKPMLPPAQGFILRPEAEARARMPALETKRQTGRTAIEAPKREAAKALPPGQGFTLVESPEGPKLIVPKKGTFQNYALQAKLKQEAAAAKRAEKVKAKKESIRRVKAEVKPVEKTRVVYTAQKKVQKLIDEIKSHEMPTGNLERGLDYYASKYEKFNKQELKTLRNWTQTQRPYVAKRLGGNIDSFIKHKVKPVERFAVKTPQGVFRGKTHADAYQKAVGQIGEHNISMVMHQGKLETGHIEGGKFIPEIAKPTEMKVRTKLAKAPKKKIIRVRKPKEQAPPKNLNAAIKREGGINIKGMEAEANEWAPAAKFHRRKTGGLTPDEMARRLKDQYPDLIDQAEDLRMILRDPARMKREGVSKLVKSEEFKKSLEQDEVYSPEQEAADLKSLEDWFTEQGKKAEKPKLKKAAGWKAEKQPKLVLKGERHTPKVSALRAQRRRAAGIIKAEGKAHTRQIGTKTRKGRRKRGRRREGC